MSNKGFTLIELLIVVVIVGILALAAIPLIASNTEEARSSEARASLGAMKDRARVVYQRSPNTTWALNTLGINSTELAGSYFTSASYTLSGTGATFGASCANVYTATPTQLDCNANLVTGSATFNR
jgi:prepilin-type N-terminal cleavage/methylation domain-containing protein